ncbi:MAG: hypothetical protein ABI132_05460 [Rhodanobacteraceae bacterium]
MKHRSMVESSLAFLLALFAAIPAARAADYSLDGGAVHFAAPDAWTVLMEKQDGDPQFLAFQVRDPASSGDTLARITVSTQHASDLAAFQQFVNDGIAKARRLPGYLGAGQGGADSAMRYTATENKRKTAYFERYYYHNGIGIQVRCVRPDAGNPQWNATFDAGCQAIATAVSH